MLTTGLAALNGYPVSDFEVKVWGDVWADCGDDTCSFVAEDEGFLNGEVTIAAMDVVMDYGKQMRCRRTEKTMDEERTIAATEASGLNFNLAFARCGGPTRALLDAKVFRTMEDDSRLTRDSRRHGWVARAGMWGGDVGVEGGGELGGVFIGARWW